MSDDVTLVEGFQAGDRDAFARLIAKHQNYVASIAYSATGDFSRSEDIAQQTFVTAWQNQRQLRDASKWLSWVSGIARNLLRNEYRLRSRERSTESIEALSVQAVAQDLSPPQQCINAEQSRMLWSILEQIPESYREPLILYYREGKSVASVAQLLGESEVVVRQRLSRGRKMVKSEIAQFVEESLWETRPTSQLCSSIMAALPAVGSGVATKAVGSIAVSWIPIKFLLLAIGPLVGIAGAVFGSKRSLDQATSAQERSFLWKMISASLGLVCVLITAQLLGVFVFPEIYHYPLVQFALWGGYALALVAFIRYGNLRLREIKAEHGSEAEKDDSITQLANPPSTTAVRWNLLGALAGMSTAIWVMSWLAGDWLFLGLSLASMMALMAFVWVQAPRHKTVVAQLHFNGKVSAAGCGMVAVQVILRWDVWWARLPDGMQASVWLTSPVSGWLLGIAIALLGVILYAFLRWQANRINVQIKGR